MKHLKKTIFILLLIYSASLLALEDTDQNAFFISPQLALPIGIKIWFNESDGSINGLTSWNKGENFASIGIGHSIWHPYPSKRASKNSGFPNLLNYMKTRGIDIPGWLQGKNGLYCPWKDRSEFTKARNSKKMAELRTFLQKTIPVQAEYMARHLQEILPELLASTPVEERWFISEKFNALASTPSGIYALIDYLNFKGPGLGLDRSRQNYEHGTGLLQVLRGMRSAPKNSTILEAYVWSAKHALIRRVERASSSQHTELWLAGWFKRLNTYLEGDFETKVVTNKPSSQPIHVLRS